MIAWQTENSVCKAVMHSLKSAGYKIKPMSEFYPTPSIFYGLLRGSTQAIDLCKYTGHDFYYIDNGYFGAEYVDSRKNKVLTGKYRIVKNDTVQKYPHEIKYDKIKSGKNIFLVIPPSIYSAVYFKTTPEDWMVSVIGLLAEKKFQFRIRTKESKIKLEDDLKDCCGLVTCNSTSSLRGMELDIPVYDTHGIFRNFYEIIQENFYPRKIIDCEKIKLYYTEKQWDLSQIARRESCLTKSI